MLIYDFSKRGTHPLYEYLYHCLKEDILSGRIPAGTKLPSKRELAADNQISVRTVMNAYDQLLTEGYITSEEKRGYFAAKLETTPGLAPYQAAQGTVHAPYGSSSSPAAFHDGTAGSGSARAASRSSEEEPLYKEDTWFADFTSNNTIYEKFPFSLWRKTMREVLSEYDLELVQRAHFLGVPALRNAIADYLYRSRGMNVSPECIVIGASIEYLYEKLIKLLPERSVYGAENPGYRKIPRIYEEFGLPWKSIEMDESGLSMESLRESGANIVHVSPEHHYPLGTVTTAGRRQELLAWTAEAADRYIIEDDYDCEFRYSTKSIPALQSMDTNHRVIYMNTFSKSLAPAIRISYMVLPKKLMERYIARANFYSNSASSCEQHALARFIENGSFERHLSRLKKYYRQEGERLLRIIKQSSLIPASQITGGSCGTHLLVYLDTSMTDVEIRWAARSKGINLACLSEFCTEVQPEYEHVLVLNYCDLDERTLAETVRRLGNIFIQW